MVDLVKQWKEAARRDDLFEHMVPSDVRLLVKEIERLRQALADAHGLLISYEKASDRLENLTHDVELHFSVCRLGSTIRDKALALAHGDHRLEAVKLLREHLPVGTELAEVVELLDHLHSSVKDTGASE